MKSKDDPNLAVVSEHEAWLADLTSEGLAGNELRSLLAERIADPELVEQAAREVEIAQRVRRLVIRLQELEMEVSSDFEAKLMARVSEDVALLNLLEVYLTGFGWSLIELINALFSFFPERPRTSAV